MLIFHKYKLIFFNCKESQNAFLRPMQYAVNLTYTNTLIKVPFKFSNV